jgi:plasmid maintenance system killer protein
VRSFSSGFPSDTREIASRRSLGYNWRMEILGKLFGSKDIVKILRLFLFNPQSIYELGDIIKHTRVQSSVVKREIVMLSSIGFVKKKSFFKTPPARRHDTKEPKKKRANGFVLNEQFPYLYGLQQLLTGNAVFSKNNIAQRLSRAGKIKLIVTSGIFIRNPDSRVDLLVVGDAIKKKTLESAIRNMEAELGKELRCAIFSTPEFTYRASSYDRLIRDIFDYPHETVLDKMSSISGL